MPLLLFNAMLTGSLACIAGGRLSDTFWANSISRAISAFISRNRSGDITIADPCCTNPLSALPLRLLGLPAPPPPSSLFPHDSSPLQSLLCPCVAAGVVNAGCSGVEGETDGVAGDAGDSVDWPVARRYLFCTSRSIALTLCIPVRATFTLSNVSDIAFTMVGTFCPLFGGSEFGSTSIMLTHCPTCGNSFSRSRHFCDCACTMSVRFGKYGRPTCGRGGIISFALRCLAVWEECDDDAILRLWCFVY